MGSASKGDRREPDTPRRRAKDDLDASFKYARTCHGKSKTREKEDRATFRSSTCKLSKLTTFTVVIHDLCVGRTVSSRRTTQKEAKNGKC